MGIISWSGSFRGRFGDHFRVGDHFGVGIISGAVQISQTLKFLIFVNLCPSVYNFAVQIGFCCKCVNDCIHNKSMVSISSILILSVVPKLFLHRELGPVSNFNQSIK